MKEERLRFCEDGVCGGQIVTNRWNECIHLFWIFMSVFGVHGWATLTLTLPVFLTSQRMGILNVGQRIEEQAEFEKIYKNGATLCQMCWWHVFTFFWRVVLIVFCVWSLTSMGWQCQCMRCTVCRNWSFENWLHKVRKCHRTQQENDQPPFYHGCTTTA